MRSSALRLFTCDSILVEKNILIQKRDKALHDRDSTINKRNLEIGKNRSNIKTLNEKITRKNKWLAYGLPSLGLIGWIVGKFL